MPLDQLIEDAFQRDAVQWIARMFDGFGHGDDMLSGRHRTVNNHPSSWVGRDCRSG